MKNSTFRFFNTGRHVGTYKPVFGDNDGGSQPGGNQPPASGGGNQPPATGGNQPPATGGKAPEPPAPSVEDLKALKAELADSLAKLKNAEEGNKLTKSEKEALNKRSNQLQEELMTEKQRAEAEQTRIRTEYDRQLKAAKDEAESFKNRYTDSTITRALLDASIQAGAVNPQQVTALFKNATKLEEVFDDQNKPTGEYVVKATILSKDAKGQPVTLTLPVAEAIKEVAKQEDHYNLFKAGIAGGTGHRQGRAEATTVSEATSSMSSWKKNREKFVR